MFGLRWCLAVFDGAFGCEIFWWVLWVSCPIRDYGWCNIALFEFSGMWVGVV